MEPQVAVMPGKYARAIMSTADSIRASPLLFCCAKENGK
jgi:hypothetical protein